MQLTHFHSIGRQRHAHALCAGDRRPFDTCCMAFRCQ